MRWTMSSSRLQRAVTRVVSRRGERAQVPALSQWLDEFWVPHRSELVRVPAAEVQRIDAERDYVRLHVGTQSYLLLQTITSLEERLDPERFIRIHRSCILQRSHVSGLRHEGLGVWSAETADGEALRIGRTYLPGVKKMAGR
jgi:two-component system response regulator AlgR